MILKKRLQFLSALLLFLSACVGVIHAARSPELIWEFSVAAPVHESQEEPRVNTVFDYSSPAGTAHSPAIVLHPDGFSLVWFDGTRESHEDVVIKQARFTKSDLGWANNNPNVYFDKEALSKKTTPRQIILSLGNTVQYGDEQNAALATIVSIGGWAAASISKVDFIDGLPAAVRKLSLSPFLNRSHLVRAPTVAYADGSVAIPAYFELGNAFGELVRLDKDGYVRDKRRMSQGRFAIQPMIVPLDAKNAVALMRNFDEHSDRLIATWTENGGRSWSPARLLEVPNPNSPVAAILLHSNDLLMVFNDSPTDARVLRLAISKDQGHTWKTVRTLEQDGGVVRYPAMARLPDGDILLTYSVGSKRGIKALIFNENWILEE
jgi:predicted neuraminidase